MQFLVNDAVLARLSCVSLPPSFSFPRITSPSLTCENGAEGTKPSHATITLAMASSTCLVFILFAAQKATISVQRAVSAQRGRTGEAKLSSPSRDANPPSALYIGRGHHPRVCTVGLVIPPFFICIIAALIRPRERVSRERKRESLSPPPPGDIGRTVRITFLSPQPP